MNLLDAALINPNLNRNNGVQPNIRAAQTYKTDTDRDTNKNTSFKAANRANVKKASIAGSLIGILSAVGIVYALAKKGNPLTSIKNLNYDEKDVLIVGAGSVMGGLIGGLLADKNKENITPKLREASQQFFGNMCCPIGLLALTTRLLEKSGFKLPQIQSKSKLAQFLNIGLAALPKVAVTVLSLIFGMEMGNKIMNKVNNKIFKEEVKHDVHAEDYLVHADDLCLAANLLLKDTKSISKVTSKILPFTFIVAGSKTGMQEKDTK